MSEVIDNDKFVNIVCDGIELVNYEINRRGVIRRKKDGYIFKNSTKVNKDKGTTQYIKVSLGQDGWSKDFCVHKLLAQTFIPNPNNYSDVNHINGNKEDYRLENLEWTSRSENNHKGAIRSDNKTGYKGVSGPYKRALPYLGKLTHEGKNYQKYFKTKEEAINFVKDLEHKVLGYTAEYNSQKSTDEQKNKEISVSTIRSNSENEITGLVLTEYGTWQVRKMKNKVRINKTFKTKDEAIQYMKDNDLYIPPVKSFITI